MLPVSLLFIVLGVVVARAFWRVVDGVVEGMRGAARAAEPACRPRGVQMVRDPVCGTFVVPYRAVTIADGRASVFFCSDDVPRQYPHVEHVEHDRHTA